MKQQLRNIDYRKLIIAATIVAAIVIAIILFANFQRHKRQKHDLQELQISTEKVSNDFETKYSELSDEKKAELKKNFQEFIDNFFNEGTKEEFEEYDDIKNKLKELPSEYALVLQREDIFSMLFGKCQQGLSSFNSFVAQSRLGYPSSLIMAQFTTNLDPIYYWVEFDGNTYHVVEDKTRDGYDDDNGYVEMYGRYFNVEIYENKDGTFSEYGYITDNSSLTYKKIQEYYERVENGDEHLKEPQFVAFYIANYTADEYKDFMLSPDRVSKEFVSEYSGYTDMHPSFADENPVRDYDEDGILDRIYREYRTISNGRDMVNVYCLLGNGNNITLAKNSWGELFRTEVADFTKDRKKDICFFQYTKTPSKTEYGLSIFEYKNGNYVAMKLPESRFETVEIVTDQHGNKKIQGVLLPNDDGKHEKVIISYEGSEWIITDRKVEE